MTRPFCASAVKARASVQVVLRVRPPLVREVGKARPFQNTVMVDPSRTLVTLSEDLPSLAKGTSNNTNLVSIVEAVPAGHPVAAHC